MTTFGHLLRRYRERAGISLRTLAPRAGISKNHLSRVELGQRPASRPMIDALTTGLRLPPRERDTLLIAAGFAPDWLTVCLDDPELLYRLWAEARYSAQRVAA